MTAAHYAQGKRAYGTCGRGGHRLYLKDMRRDPLTGLMVDPDWAEPPLMRPATDIIDGVVLRRPAPELDRIGTIVYIGNIIDFATGDPVRPLIARYQPLPNLSEVTAILTTDTGEELLTDDGSALLIADGSLFVG